MYQISSLAGQLFASCLILGSIPYIIARVRNRNGASKVLMLLCGVIGVFSIPLGLVSTIICSIIAAFLKDNSIESSNPELVFDPSANEIWVCNSCKTSNSVNVGSCQKCGVSRQWSESFN